MNIINKTNKINLLNINNEKILITSFFGINRNNEVLKFQNEVFNKFNIPINYLYGEFHKGINYGELIDFYIKSVIDRVDYFIFFDIDAVPLKNNSINFIYEKIKDKKTVFGISQQSNHIIKNGSPNHPYAGMSIFGMSRDLYINLSYPSFKETYRGDVAEEITWLCEEKGYCVSLIYPSSFYELSEKEMKFCNMDKPYFNLGNGLKYGLGTTYRDLLFHTFMQSLPKSTEIFINKCKEILGENKNNTFSYKNIEGWFDFEDIYEKMVNEFSNGIFIEIGAWKGKSTAFMAQKIKDSNKDIKFYTVDTFLGNNNDELCTPKNGENIFEIFKSNIKKCSVDNYVNVIRDTSEKAASSFTDNSLDFVFIDGGHLYEEVVNDLRNWYDKVKNGGYIGGHDYACYAPQVQKAVNEFFGENNIIKPIRGSSWLYKKGDKLSCIICCVDMSDLLETTLPFNKDYFDEILIVTSDKDQDTINVCNENGVKYITTDLFWQNNHQFDRGAAINYAYQFLKYKDWCLHLDADIILPKAFRKNLNLENLNKDLPYGISRKFIWTQKEYDLWNNRQIEDKDLSYIEGGYFCGYFQLWNFNAKRLQNIPLDKLYPSGNSTINTDIQFLYRFCPDINPKPEKLSGYVIHLGPPGINNEGKNNCRFENFKNLKFSQLPDLRHNEIYKNCELVILARQILNKTNDRDYVFKQVLNKFNNKPINILEIGTSRSVNGKEGDGWSTVFWADYIDKNGGKLDIVDISKNNLLISELILINLNVMSNKITFNLIDGFQFLLYNNKYDLIYLDGGDDSSECLEQFEAIDRTKSHILIDDFHTKGKLISEKYKNEFELFNVNNIHQMALFSKI